MQQLELGLGNITVDEFGISVMLLSFISIEKREPNGSRFSDGINYFCRLYFFKVGIYDIIVFLCRSIGLCALAGLGFGLRLRVNHFAQFWLAVPSASALASMAVLSSPFTASSASFSAASIFLSRQRRVCRRSPPKIFHGVNQGFGLVAGSDQFSQLLSSSALASASSPCVRFLLRSNLKNLGW